MQRQNIFPLHQRPDIPLKVHSVWSLMFITSRERLHYSHHYTYSGLNKFFFFQSAAALCNTDKYKKQPSLEYKHKKKISINVKIFNNKPIWEPTACFDSRRSIQTLFTPYITQLSKLIKKISQPFKQNVRKISMLDHIS